MSFWWCEPLPLYSTQSWKIHPLHVGTCESEMEWEKSLQLKMQKMYEHEHAIQSYIIIYLRC